MKLTSALLALPATVLAQSIAQVAAYSADEYAAGEVHQRVMDIKNV
jgi:hypothetical protein